MPATANCAKQKCDKCCRAARCAPHKLCLRCKANVRPNSCVCAVDLVTRCAAAAAVVCSISSATSDCATSVALVAAFTLGAASACKESTLSATAADKIACAPIAASAGPRVRAPSRQALVRFVSVQLWQSMVIGLGVPRPVAAFAAAAAKNRTRNRSLR